MLAARRSNKALTEAIRSSNRCKRARRSAFDSSSCALASRSATTRSRKSAAGKRSAGRRTSISVVGLPGESIGRAETSDDWRELTPLVVEGSDRGRTRVLIGFADGCALEAPRGAQPNP